MQYVLMMIIGATSFSAPSSSEVTVYDNQYDCQLQADELNEGSHNVMFICLEELKKN